MPKDLLDEEEITLEKLREQFQNNDFTQTALRAYSEYTLEEVEFHNEIRSYVHENWSEVLKEFGIKNPESCFSKDYPPELIREYLEKLIADIIISIDCDEKVLDNILETFVYPILEQENCDELADQYLHNTVNALMQTVNIKELAEVSKEYSADEDFSTAHNTNYSKMDHDKKWNHSRAKMKVESLDEIAERSPTGESPQISDKTNIEATADIHILIENLIESSTEQERDIINLLSEGYTQSEIAQKLGVSQSTVSRKVLKFKKFLSANV